MLGKSPPEEYAALEADILKRGIMFPVEKDEDGNTLDGHHREKIAKKHSLKCPTVVRRFKTEEEKREHVIKLNLARRHLEPYEWGLGFEKLLEAPLKEAIKKAAEEGAPTTEAKAQTICAKAAEVGVSRQTASARMKAAAAFKALPAEKKKEVKNREKRLVQAVQEVKQEKREAAVAARAIEVAKTLPKTNDYGVKSGDFRKVAESIADASVDLIFTDPPYDRKTLPLYGDLAQIGARVLVEGGSLICYLGQYQMGEVLDLMRPHLRFWWILAVQHTGQLARMREYGIVVHWKPLLWFVKGTRGDKQTFVEDLVVSTREG